MEVANQILYMLLLAFQGYILGPLLFLAYINNLPNASRLFDPIKFTDDTNLFFSYKVLLNENEVLLNINA